MTRGHCSHTGRMSCQKLSHESQSAEVAHCDNSANSESEAACVPAHRGTQPCKHLTASEDKCPRVSIRTDCTRDEVRPSSCSSPDKGRWTGFTQGGVFVAREPRMARGARLRGFSHAEKSRLSCSIVGFFLLSFALHLARGAVTRLSVAQQPGRAVARELFVDQPLIYLRDSTGELDMGNWQIRASIVSNTTQPLGGTTFITSVNGTADFSDLVLARPAQDVVLRFSLDGSSSILVDSSPFAVAAGVSSLDVLTTKAYEKIGLTSQDIIAGGDLSICYTEDACISLFQFCTRYNYSDPEAVADSRYNASETNCTELEENENLGTVPACRLQRNCNVSGEAFHVALLDGDSKLIEATRAPVFASAVPLDGSSGALLGTVTDFSCCRHERCSSLYSACCDCSLPECALCAIPQDGIVSFPAARVEKAGSYRMRFEVKQFSYNNDDVTQTRVERTYEIVDDIVINILPGVVDSLQVLKHPSTISAELRPSASSSVLLVPQPEVSFTDKFRNPTSAAILGVVVAHLCYADEDSGADLVPGLCRCSNETCWKLEALQQSQEKAERFLNGNVMAAFTGNAAAFTDLAVTVARSDLQLAIHMFQNGRSSPPIALTNMFGIAPGDVNSMLVADDPSRYRGCNRCPIGVHFVGAQLRARIKIYDVAGNLITPDQAQERVNTTLYFLDRGRFVVASEVLVPEPQGQRTSMSQSGVAEFLAMRMRRTGDVFQLEFGLQAKWMIRTLAGNFSIVNGRPEKLRAIGWPYLYSADQEVFVSQPQLELLDSFDNRVISDCYTSCVTGTCNAFDSACPEVVTASLQLGGPPLLGQPAPALNGRKTAVFNQGVARFTDLYIDSGDPACGNSLTREFTVSFNVAPLAGTPMTNSTDSLTAVVQRRVESLFILVYPTRVVARQTFQVAPQILARDCQDVQVENATARIQVSIRDDAGGGTLSGSRTVLLNKGSASFGTISIDLFGDGYTLQFQYIGNTVVQAVVSTPFSVERSSSRLIVLRDTQGRNLNGTITEANQPFAVQPVVGVFDSANQLVDLSTAQITASIFRNPGNLQAHDPGKAVLLGTTIISAKRGVATFTDLRIQKASLAQGIVPPMKYTLLFALQEVIVESEEFDIKPAPQLRGLIAFDGPHQAPTPDIAGNMFAVQPLVFLTDTYGNRLSPNDLVKDYFVDIELQRQFGSVWGTAGNDTLIADRCLILRDGEAAPGVACEGQQPLKCTNIDDCQASKAKNARQAGLAFWTDLRVDIAATYRFRFAYSDPDQIDPPAEATSETFTILNSLPSYASIEDQVAPVNIADEILKVQPKVTVKDVFGNKVVVDDIENRQVSVELLTESGLLPTQPPDPPVPGQADDTICRLAPTLMEGNFVIAVDLTTGDATFTDLAIRQVMTGYRLRFYMPTSQGTKIQTSARFRVDPGWAVGLCNMSLPSLCQSDSPCINGGRIACVDSYGNVQPSCLAFFYGVGQQIFTGSPFTIPDTAHVDCRGTVCARLIERSPGAVLSSQELNGGLDCATTFCQTSIATGYAPFNDLSVSLPGTTFVLEFRTYVWNAYIQRAYEWKFVSPAFNVTPVSPSIVDVQFNYLVNQVYVLFDRATNMNGWPEQGRDSSCTREMEMSTVLSLGQNPYCTWIAENTFVMSVGGNAYINESTSILLNPNSAITASEVANGVFMTSLPAITIKGRIIGGVVLQDIFPRLPALLPKPQPTMFGPKEITSCDTLNLNAARSQGYAGRVFEKIKFAIDLSQSQTLEGFLRANEPPEPTFSKRRIHFGEQIPGLETTVTVTLRPDTALLPGTNMTITGLPVYSPPQRCGRIGGGLRTFACPQGECFIAPLSGPDAHKFTAHGSDSAHLPTLMWVVGVDPSQAVFQLKDEPGNILSDIQDTVISFQVTNPSTAVNMAPVPLDVTAHCGGCICADPACSETLSLSFLTQTRLRMDCGQVCLNDRASYELPTRNVSFLSAEVSESTRVNGAVNTITLDFVLSESLGAGGEIVLSNLLMVNATPPADRICVFGANASALQCLSCMNMSNSLLSWGETGDLVMAVAEGAVLRANQRAQLQFRVTNPVEVNREDCGGDRLACRSLIKPRIGVRYTQGGDLSVMSLQGDVLGAGATGQFLEAVAVESNAMQDTESWIEMRFASSMDIENGTRIEVAGLYAENLKGIVGANGINDSIPLFGDNETTACFIFQNMLGYGELDSKTGVLALTVDKDCLIPARKVIRFFVQMRNAVASRGGSRVFITASNQGCVACVPKFCPCLKTDASNLDLPRTLMSNALFTSTNAIRVQSGSIQESNGVPGQPNTILVSVLISVPVLEGTVLQISGFQSSLSVPSYELPVQVGNFTVIGRLDINGNVTVVLPKEFEAMETISLHFVIKNGFEPARGIFAVSGHAVLGLCQKLECPAFLDATGNKTLDAVALTGDALLLTETSSIIFATIKESTRVLGAMNVITVRLHLNFELVVGASIEIRGLPNTGTSAVTGLTAVSDYEQILPNCSCPSTCATCTQVCDTCTQAAKLRIAQQFRIWNPEVDEGGMTVFGTPRMESFQPDGKDVVGFWHPAIGNGVLNISVARTFPAGQDLLFGFALSNPFTAKQETRPTVSIKAGDIEVPDFAMDGDVLGSDLEAAFTFASITEVLGVDGGISSLRVVLEANCPLLSPQPPGMQISISGLRGFSTSFGAISVFGVNRFDVASSAVADWTASANGDGGTLVLTGGTIQGGCSSLENFDDCAQSDSGQMVSAWRKEFTFYLKRSRGVPIASTPTVSARSAGLQFKGFAMTTNMVQSQLPEAAFLAASISDNSQLASVPNRLTVSFQVNVDLLESSTITVMGLFGASTESTDQLAVAGEDGEIFGFVGSWYKNEGQFVVAVAPDQVVERDQMVTFEFTITNPVAAQDPGSVFITGTLFAPPRPEGAPPPVGLAIDGIDVEGEVLAASLLPAFLTRRVSESTTVNGAINTVTVSLSANIPLPVGAEITIAGLNSVSEPAEISIREGDPGMFGGRAVWGGGVLRLMSRQAIGIRHMVSFSFQVQNKVCNTPCGTPVFVNASGGAAARVLQLASTEMEGRVLGASGSVAWVSKAMHESTRTRESRNNLTFALQPNAPMYEGSVVVIEGLVYSPNADVNTERIVVQPCYNCEGGPPRCFAGGVETSTATIYELENCMIGVSIRDESGSRIPAAVFGGSAMWNLGAGTLSLTIASGMVLPEDRRTVFNIFVRNSVRANAPMQCGKTADEDFKGDVLFTAADGEDCLIVVAPVANLCSLDAIDTPSCAGGNLISSSISTFTPAVDHQNVPLLDRCSTCLRQLDLVHVDDILQEQETLVISDLEVSSPTTRGLPKYISGGVVPGTYFVVLDVTNWVGEHGDVRFDFTKREGVLGPTRSEAVEPLLYFDDFDASESLRVTADTRIEIKTKGSAALCQPGAGFEVLDFQWSMACLSGFRNHPCELFNYTRRTDLRVLTIPPGALPPGSKTEFTVLATQESLQIDPAKLQRKVTVEVSVRPPVPVIAGVNSLGTVSVMNGNVVVSAESSYDPEFSVTQMTAADFAFSWGCEYLDPSTDAFVPCLDGFGFFPDPLNPLPVAAAQGISTSETLTLTPALLSRNGTYRIAVSAFRGNTSEIQKKGLEVASFGSSSIGYSSVHFTTAAQKPLLVDARLCDASDLGTAALCTTRRHLGVNANERTVLFADTTGTPTGSFLLQWETFGSLAAHILQPENLLTAATRPLLIIDAGVLNPGHTVRFRVTLTDRRGTTASGYSEIVLEVNVPPLAGTLTVEPSTGNALQTEFQIESQAWTSDPDHLPLTFKFTVTVDGRIRTALPLSRGYTQTINTLLPAGNPASDQELGIQVEVFDSRGASSLRSITARVVPGDLSINELRSALTLLTAGDDADAMVSGVGSVALTMHDPEECADHGNGTVTTYLAAPPACKAVLDERRAFRKQLLSALQTLQSALPSSSDSLTVQGEVLNSIVRSPLELDRETTRQAHTMIKDMMRSARGLRGGHNGFHNVAANTMHALILASQAQAVPGTGPAPPPPPSVNASQATGRRTGSSVGDMASVQGLAQQAHEGNRRASISADDTTMTLELLEGISRVSSLSVSDQEDGQKAVHVSTALYSMSTRRVSLDPSGFIPGAPKEPLSMNVPGTDARISLPASLVDVLDRQGSATGSGEVMLLVWNYANGPLPQSYGPAVGIEVRRLGSAAHIPFGTLDIPFTVELPLVRSISNFTDPITGEGFTAFGSYFDVLTWTWKSDGISKATALSSDTVITSLSTHFSHFSVVEVKAGCDKLPLSGVIMDGCMVCGGDNSTCSGCNGIPNTGLNRFCSGHGQCGVDKCSCQSNYYGEECFTYCNNLVTCSGHGFCDADFDGRRCNCMEGWAEGFNTYPGPFCARQIGQENGTLSTPAPYVKEDDSSGQLAMILAIVFSILGVCVVGGGVFWFVSRQRAVAQSVKKTIIDFSADDPHIGDPPIRAGQKKPLLLEAAPAPAMLAAPAPAPDEGTWEADMADATATFSYGPNSGYLASAVAANTRTNMGQLAVERIDRRSRVMKNQIKEKQKMTKYSAPRLDPMLGDDEDDGAMIELLPTNGHGNGRIGGPQDENEPRAFPLVMQSADGRWEDPFHEVPATNGHGNGNGNGNGHSHSQGTIPFHSRFSGHWQDSEFDGLHGDDSADHDGSLENGDRGEHHATWQVTQPPEWVNNSGQA